MKKTVILSIAASVAIMAGGDIKAVEPEVSEPTPVVVESEGEVSGQLRAFYIDRTYSGTINNNRNSLNVGGWIGYDSPEWNGLSFGTKFYVTEGVKIHSDPYSTASYDPSLYGDNFESYGFIGEAYLNYKMGNTNLKVGRQRLDTPLAGADDARMLPSLFEAAVLSNTDIADTTLILAHVTKESVGTFGNVYTPGALSLQSGYGLGFKEGTSGKFADMGVIALGAGTDTSGVTAGAVIYKGIDNLSLQVWDYFAHDILNALYLQADYKLSAVKLSAQYINESDVGGRLAGNVDSSYWAVKAGTSFGDLSGYVAYSQTSDNSGSAMNGGVLTPWGGMPAFTQGMVTRHMFFAGTDTWKVASTYNLENMTGLKLKATGYYVNFDIGATNTYKPGQSWTAKEAGFDIKYQATKALNLRLRGNFPTDFAPGLDWKEYRFIVNYKF
ncbi:OprD family outer membrane porin [Sulfurovum sp. ST-21]|uniref:Outer membrane porin, OprD family n=1 Tax=Sulfurovum indicum TaxID=2779528 RepID=A0A7M1S2I2_9BACT|nr:OprD family outer membrane porin [Sulfurovum indicum]QOR61272.1 outer membrane porin, OprD family [Sulfurovum indicum]